MKRSLLLITGLLACTLTWADIKVVYHLSEGIPQASRAIGNIRNHLAADPTAKIVWSHMAWASTFCWTGPPTRWTSHSQAASVISPAKALNFGSATTPW